MATAESFVDSNGPNHIVHARPDQTLDELFQVAIDGDVSKSRQVPMRLRNLPPSFFQQPEAVNPVSTIKLCQPHQHHQQTQPLHHATQHHRHEQQGGLPQPPSPQQPQQQPAQPQQQQQQQQPVHHHTSQHHHQQLHQQQHHNHHHHTQQQQDSGVGGQTVGSKLSVVAAGPATAAAGTTAAAAAGVPGAGNGGGGVVTVGAAGKPPPAAVVVVSHSRAHSSPATLEQTYRTGSPHHQPTHTRQQSYDLVDEAPLPPGWEMARTSLGQKYFLNHDTHTTTWEDPRRKFNGSVSASQHSTAPPPPHTANPSVVNAKSLGPLPDGWDQATTADGEVYFINHIDRTTSWFDPRIPIHAQQRQAMAVAAAATTADNVVSSTTVLHQQQQHHQQHQQLSPAVLVGLQQQQQQAMNNPGVVIVGGLQSPLGSNHNLNRDGVGSTDSINAVCVATSTLSIQQQQQRQRQVAALQQQQQRGIMQPDKVQLLQMECEQMKQRQQELLKQPLFGLGLQELNNNNAMLAVSQNQLSVGSGVVAGTDPFLGGNPHSRQESADSGLGLGANISLQPDEYLGSVENPGAVGSSSSSTTLSSEHNLTGMDDSTLEAALAGPVVGVVSASNVHTTEQMDSDDIMNSLNEMPDLINDMDDLFSDSKDQVLTWL